MRWNFGDLFIQPGIKGQIPWQDKFLSIGIHLIILQTTVYVHVVLKLIYWVQRWSTYCTRQNIAWYYQFFFFKFKRMHSRSTMLEYWLIKIWLKILDFNIYNLFCFVANRTVCRLINISKMIFACFVDMELIFL